MRDYYVCIRGVKYEAFLCLDEVNSFLFYTEKVLEFIEDGLWVLPYIKIPLIGRIKCKNGMRFKDYIGESLWDLYHTFIYCPVRDHIENKIKRIYIPFPYYYLKEILPEDIPYEDDFTKDPEYHELAEEQIKFKPIAKKEYEEYMEFISRLGNIRHEAPLEE